ncbi:hypothetical protein [Niastella sp. OAS944]|uniref:hypothetical protein n=1 Tax=Niastella sp. OAS944 TaxID=2664089 RepID=UPI00346CCA8A|nr:hypothetical protein [Chitinophagaceae bacterium OAS944]
MENILYLALVQRGYKVAMRPFELNVIGIRSNTSVPNVFNDSLNVLFMDNTGRLASVSWRATTDPGTYWLKSPMNPQGTAILKPGQYVGSHGLGMHRGKYLALVQIRPVTVIRDFNRDGKLDYTSGKEETGLFGINIHRAMVEGTTKTIDKYSAGCQVFANANDFSVFLSLAERHKNLYGNSFTYTLLSGLPDGSIPEFDKYGKPISKKN